MFQMFKALLIILILSSCSTVPKGPSVLVLPGKDKDFTHFHDDDVLCRKFAHGQVTALQTEPDSKEEGHQSYDIGYIQCMYAKGHIVPVPGEIMNDTLPESYSPAPPNMPPSQ